MINQPKYANDPHGYYKPCQGTSSYEILAIDGTVRTPTIPAGARMARIYFRGANIRFTMHGIDPTSILGVPVYDGYEEWFSYFELLKLRFIREGSTNGEAHIVYYN